MAREEHPGRFTEDRFDFSGYHVYDRHYEKIGQVDDLFVDENDQPEYIGVKMGFLGTRSTLIPVDIVRVNDKRQLVEVESDKETVKEGPTFSEDRELTAEFERQVLKHYRVEAARASSERGAYGAYYYSDAAAEDKRVDILPGERTGEGGPHGRSDERHTDMVTRSAIDRPEHDVRDLGGEEDELRVQRVEEELRAGTREREAGQVNVRKRVRTEREQIRVPKRHEEVRVERVPVEEGAASSEPNVTDDEIRIPIVEEEVVVEKRPVVKEEIRLRKDIAQEEEVVERDVRKEEVEIDDQTKPRRNS